MTPKTIIKILLLPFLLFSCTDEPSALEMLKDINKPSGPYKYSGVRITNELPRGSEYKGDKGEMYAFRSTRTYITNDTLFPIHLKIEFPSKFITLKRLKDEAYKELVQTDRYYRVFLLPDSMTPDKQFDFVTNNHYVSKDLEKFLDNELDAATILKKVILPQETYTLNLGYLFKPDDVLTRAELFSNGHAHNLSIPANEINLKNSDIKGLELKLGINVNPPYYYSTFNCGKIDFQK